MSINPIRNDDLQAVLRRRESICQAAEQTPEADERDMLVTRLEAYENPHDDFGPADPIDVIKLQKLFRSQVRDDGGCGGHDGCRRQRG